MKIKILLFFIFLLFSCKGICQHNNVEIDFIPKRIRNGEIRANYLPVTMPGNERKMGLLGVHCNFGLPKGLYAGVNMFSAVSGERGGLFTLGIEAGIKQKIYSHIYADASLNFGGGGGDRAPVGGGAYLSPNIGLSYNCPEFSLGAQYSYIDFYSGKIKSSGFSCFLEIPFTLKYAPYSKANQCLNQQSADEGGFNQTWNENAFRNSFLFKLDNFFPVGNSKNTSGGKLEHNIYLIGFEYNRYFKNNSFLFLQADGGYKGIQAGFMDLFGGIGYHFFSPRILSVAPKIAIGAGGGGRIQTDGGFLIYPSLNITQKINSKFAIAEHAGYLFSPFGSFQGVTAGLSLKYNTFTGGIKNPVDGRNFQFCKIKGLQILIENQTYIKAARVKEEPITINLIALQFNADFSKWFYTTGEAAFAYQGESGGYAEGLIGAGIHSPVLFNEKLQFVANGMLGTGGGGGIYTNQGFIVKPSGGINFYIGDEFALHASLGRVIAPFGGLNSLNFNCGLIYSFSTLASSDLLAP